MYSYLRVLRRAYEQGRFKGDRTGTGCYSIFGDQIRHNMADGFPLVTTRQLRIGAIVKELLWFINGDTNINDPSMGGCKIWDHWALKSDTYEVKHMSLDELMHECAQKGKVTLPEVVNYYRAMYALESLTNTPDVALQKTRVAMANRFEVDDSPRQVLVGKAGSIGPMYGKQWRDFEGVDQLKEAINLLRVDPNSRRNVVSAWNPKYLPDPSKSIEDNILDGKMALAPCHALFQFCAMPLSDQERFALLAERAPVMSGLVEGLFDRHGDVKDEASHAYQKALEALETYKIPGHVLSLQLYQRSADLPVGVCFNIASYALLLILVANELNMVLGEYVHTFGDAHIYSNQLSGVKEQLTRTPGRLPRIKLHCPVGKSIFDIELSDIELVGYDPQDPIDYPIAI